MKTIFNMICPIGLAILLAGCFGDPKAISMTKSSKNPICFFDVSTLGKQQDGNLKMLAGSILPLREAVDYSEGPQGKILRRVIHTYDKSIENQELIIGIKERFLPHGIKSWGEKGNENQWRIEGLRVTITLQAEDNTIRYLWTELTE